MLKKTSFLLFGLTLCTTALADKLPPLTKTTCTPSNATLSCDSQNWEIGIQGLYLQPVYSANLGYAFTTNYHRLHDIDPDMRWGYRLQGAYHYLSGSDATINWSHYETNRHLGMFNGTELSVGSNLINANYRLSLKNQFDQINLVLGQRVELGLLKDARFYGGLQYGRILVDTTHDFSAPPIVIQPIHGSVRSITNMSFNGIGPVIGIDYSYGLPHGLSIIANTAGSVLYGTTHHHFETAFNHGVMASAYASKKTMVPSLEAKLGANYAYEMSQGILNLEGGYQVVNYFNALQERPLGLFLANNDFGLYGPYFGLKWLANS